MCFFFFKQKTAYEMLRSLVGSEMCIRDSHRDRATFIGDRRARNRLELLGVKVLLFTWWDYTEHPERLVAQVRAALATTAA